MVKYKKKKFIYTEEKEEYYHSSIFNLVIDKSNIISAGKGVFTEESISDNTFIDFYTGDICYNIRCGEYFVEIDDNCGINAISFPRCYMAMINDAYNSQFINNCEIRINYNKTLNNCVEIWSIKNIEKGEELFLNYGEEYWK